MATYSETGGWCRHCDRRVVVRRPAPNHVLHLLMTLVTCGLWLVVWIGQSVRVGGWRCSQCGSGASGRAWGHASRAGAAQRAALRGR
jgi:hypothetical protein